LKLDEFANDVRIIRGVTSGEEEAEDEDAQPRFSLVNSKTCNLIPGCFFHAMDREIDVTEWALGQMRAEVEILQAAEEGGWAEGNEEEEQEGDGDQADKAAKRKPPEERIEALDDAMMARFAEIEKILLSSLATQNYDAAAESLIKTVTKWFRTLTNLVKLVTTFLSILSFSFLFFLFSSVLVLGFDWDLTAISDHC
jgi:hypothetical protein